jgi:hypothetical protein
MIGVEVTVKQTLNLVHEKNFELTDFDFVHTTVCSARWFTRLNSANRRPQEITL